jgi:hypothetical protein
MDKRTIVPYFLVLVLFSLACRFNGGVKVKENFNFHLKAKSPQISAGFFSNVLRLPSKL